MYRIDGVYLWKALDDERTKRSISWRELSRQTGVAPSTLSRLKTGAGVYADVFVTLLTWLGADHHRQFTVHAAEVRDQYTK